MNIRETFLRLTEYTTPFGTENTLEEFLPEGIRKDRIGNYFIKIGESRTMFTCHLDTYSETRQRINHVFKGEANTDVDLVGTDGTTILGGDNKTGVTIMLYLIDQGVPGLYYFFIGEEPILSGGRFGSKRALRAYKDKFQNYDRCIAFDRKKKGSIINRQSARFCCSNEFVEALAAQFAGQGLEYSADMGGYYTDSEVFMDVISEVTNLSSGTWNEHSKKEYVDLAYLKQVAEAAAAIDWEALPVARVPQAVSTPEPTGFKDIERFRPFNKKDKELFARVNWILSMFGYKCLNLHQFKPYREMVMSKWHSDSQFMVRVGSGRIYINDKMVGGYSEFIKGLNISVWDLVNADEFVKQLTKIHDDGFVAEDEMEDMLHDTFGIDLVTFRVFMDEIGFLEEVEGGFNIIFSEE